MANKVRILKEDYEQLTDRELEILQDVADGMTSRDIAIKWKISYKTIEVHRYRILKKTGARSMLQLCITLYRQGLLK